MISVVIPLYNKEGQIKKTIDSVLEQSFQNFEIIIINDGSTDKSVDVVQTFTDSRIRLFYQKNQGVSVARNRGVEVAQFDYIAFLDADDEWNVDYLKTQYQLILEYPQCGVFACAYQFILHDGTLRNLILNKLPFLGTRGLLENYFEVASCSHPPLWTSAVIVKKEAFVSVGGFPKGVISGEDLLTWARLAVKYSIAYSLNVVASYILDERYDLEGAPPRIPEQEDFVGSGLRMLQQEYPKVKGLKAYIGLWHKMRASTYLRLNDSRNALWEVFLSLKYNAFNIRTWVFMLLCFCPLSVRYRLFKRFVR